MWKRSCLTETVNWFTRQQIHRIHWFVVHGKIRFAHLNYGYLIWTMYVYDLVQVRIHTNRMSSGRIDNRPKSPESTTTFLFTQKSIFSDTRICFVFRRIAYCSRNAVIWRRIFSTRYTKKRTTNLINNSSNTRISLKANSRRVLDLFVGNTRWKFWINYCARVWIARKDDESWSRRCNWESIYRYFAFSFFSQSIH